MDARSALSPLLAALAVGTSGCGGSGGPERQTQANTTPKDRAPEARLSRPVEPRCGAEGLAAPVISRAASGWRLVYTYPRNAPREALPGEPTVISLDERHPRSQRVKYPNSRVLRLAGREVDVVRQNDNFIAQWVTKRARYNVITDASRERLERLVRCTP